MKYFDTFIVRCDNCNFEEEVLPLGKVEESGWTIKSSSNGARHYCKYCSKKLEAMENPK